VRCEERTGRNLSCAPKGTIVLADLASLRLSVSWQIMGIVLENAPMILVVEDEKLIREALAEALAGC
jgi:hypothetical protein